MELYLQFGHGMMDHTAKLLRAWRGGGVILSPRDLEPAQLIKTALVADEAGAEVLLDPQCYVRDADHARLTSHGYWETYKKCSTASLIGGSGARDVVAALGSLSRALQARQHILPGLLAAPVDDDWFTVHENFIDAAIQEFGREPLIATVALSEDAVRDEKQIEAVIERASDWRVDGFYLIGESPRPYLVDDPVWLANMLILASGLKLLRRRVIVGYGNHQMLAFAACNVDVIASGTWLNVRAFPIAKFYAVEDDEISRRTTWYYCPHVLSEYKVPFLDIAQRHGVLESMRPASGLGSTYADGLFAGAQPSTVGWGEQNAFRHYLTCLRGQCRGLSASGFAEAIEMQGRLLDEAERGLRSLRSLGVLGNDRDFYQIVDVNRSALTVLERARGPRLRREW